MARVSFLILVSIQIIVAERNLGNDCNMCIQNGNNWCHLEGSNCWPSKTDSCAGNFEKLTEIRKSGPSGKRLSITYAEQSIQPSTEYSLSIGYNATVASEIQIHVHNSSQKQYIKFSDSTKCEKSDCTATISVKPSSEFCTSLPNPSDSEYVYVNVTFVDIKESTEVKFLIQCACPCSSRAEPKSAICNKRGTYVCSVCQCDDDWTGPHCEKTKEPEKPSPKCSYNGFWSSGMCHCLPNWTGKTCSETKCGPSRDDIGCSGSRTEKGECSGNGHCDACDNNCICKTDIEGSQYLDPDSRCIDLCMIVEQCEDCLTSNGPTQCTECDIVKDPFNKTVSERRDHLNRTVWMHCNLTLVDDCQIMYLAMREDNIVHIMIEDSCRATAPAGLFGSPVTSILFGLLVLACVASLVAVVVWKYFNRIPAQELMKPGYTSVEAAPSMIQNPAYRTPISSFTNPTYQKC